MTPVAVTRSQTLLLERSTAMQLTPITHLSEHGHTSPACILQGATKAGHVRSSSNNALEDAKERQKPGRAPICGRQKRNCIVATDTLHTLKFTIDKH